MKPELTEAEHYQDEEVASVKAPSLDRLPISDRKWLLILFAVFAFSTAIGLYLTQ